MTSIEAKPIEKLDPSQEVDLKQLEKIDFSNKSEKLKEIEAELTQAAAEQQELEKDPFKSLWFLTYKGTGPIEFLLFRSTRPSPVTVRDAQVYCNTRGIKYIGCKKAFVDILKPSVETSTPIGDVTALITRQPVFSKEGLTNA